jgi:hypothetical protein
MNIKNYFLHPKNRSQLYYEALRAHFLDGLSLENVARGMDLSHSYLLKIKYDFEKKIASGINPFFVEIKFGPKICHKTDRLRDRILELRKQEFSIIDIKSVLEAQGEKISLDAIDKLLKAEGFSRLPRRKREEKNQMILPNSINSPHTSKIQFEPNERFTTGKFGGILSFLPLMESLGIFNAIEKAEFPGTSQISGLSYVLSFLALKLSGNKRFSHDETWSLERILGLFAGLNILPKSSSMSSYSYRVKKSTIKKLLSELSLIFSSTNESEFNLDFKTIPYWGDATHLEKNYSTTRGKSVQSVLALIVQNITDDCLAYTDAEIGRHNEKNAILEFIDFWKESHGTSPKMLIFDSQFTIYKNLSLLNKDQIKFITLRAKKQKMIDDAIKRFSKGDWTEIDIDAAKKGKRKLKYYEEEIILKDYEGKLRQIVVLSRDKEPVFILTNDFTSSANVIIRKYARRWLVEQEIAEQISFFHLNQLSSSMVVKVDFDLTLSLLAHNLYRKLAEDIPKYNKCTVQTLHRNFIEGRAEVKIDRDNIIVSLAKKAHLPLLFENTWMQEKTKISFLNKTISFEIGTTS